MADPTLYCTACAYPKWETEVEPCKQCGGTVFTSSLRLINWELAITWQDKNWLKSLRISAT